MNEPQISKTLVEALPFMQKYSGEKIVVKYGGHAMNDDQSMVDFARDIVLLKQAGVKPVVVHGGAPQMSAMLKRLGIESSFSNGLRVTDKETMDIAEMILSASVNKGLVSLINSVGGYAVGLSGVDGSMVKVRSIGAAASISGDDLPGELGPLGFVGEPEVMDCRILDSLLASDAIPVLSPIANDKYYRRHNVNSDSFAGKIASAIDARRLLLLTDVDGILDSNGKRIAALSRENAQQLIDDGTVTGGMIPKLLTAVQACRDGVRGTVILNGTANHATITELFTDSGSGTLVR